MAFFGHKNSLNELAAKRAQQNRQWTMQLLQDAVLNSLEENQQVHRALAETLDEQLLAGHITPRAAAGKLFEVYENGRK